MLFVDSHPAGLALADSDTRHRSRRAKGSWRVLAIVLVLLVSATGAGLLALLD
jgi:hypothetical protein